MIELRHLQIIDAIADAGTLTEAARRVNMSQPAASRALAEIEARLGFPLFYREPRGMKPTPECERLLPTATTILDMLAAARSDMASLRSGTTGLIRITTQCYTCYHWLPRALQRFGEVFPKVDVQVIGEAANAPLAALVDDSVDLAVVHSRNDDRALCFEPLFEDEVVAIVAPDHPLARRDTLRPEDFEDHVLFLHSDPKGSAIITEVLRPNGVRPPRVTTLHHTDAVIGVVAAGLGVSAVATWAAAPAIAEGAVVARRIAEGLHRTWYAAYRARDADRRHLAGLVSTIRAHPLPEFTTEKISVVG